MTNKVGIVKSINETNCTARVLFEDTGLLSAELQITYKGSGKNKEYFMPGIEEQVLVALTDQKVGYIIGSIYSDEDIPPIADKNKHHTQYEDGTIIEYDTKTHTLIIDCKGPITINTVGNVNVTGDVIANGISLENHTHSGVGAPIQSG